MNNPRFAIRQLRKNPGFTTVAVVTLALGIGANTALFSVFKGLVLEPLPYPDPLRLVHVWKSERNTHGTMSLSALDYLELRARSGCFEELGLYTVWGWNLGGGADRSHSARRHGESPCLWRGSRKCQPVANWRSGRFSKRSR